MNNIRLDFVVADEGDKIEELIAHFFQSFDLSNPAVPTPSLEMVTEAFNKNPAVLRKVCERRGYQFQVKEGDVLSVLVGNMAVIEITQTPTGGISVYCLTRFLGKQYLRFYAKLVEIFEPGRHCKVLDRGQERSVLLYRILAAASAEVSRKDLHGLAGAPFDLP